MPDNSRSPTVTEGPLACTDLLLLTAVTILYIIGKDENCGISAKDLVLAYIIIKACFLCKLIYSFQSNFI